MKHCLIFIFVLYSIAVDAQEENEALGQQIENETAANDLTEVEADEERQEMKWYTKHKVNINSVSTEFLVNNFDVPLSAATQLSQYRKLLGDLIDVYELQAVPGWNNELIASILPYIKVSGDENILPLLKSYYKKGNSYLQLRTGRVIETSKGFLTNENGQTPYVGSPLKIMLRYRFQAGKKMQWGYTTEKDAGEKIIRNAKPFFNDYHSFYFSMEQIGKLESFIAGDFEINMGQGLIHWQSAAYKKSSSSVNLLRQGYFAVPHKGLNEQLFHRGVAMSVKVKKIFVGLFAAYNLWDGNLVTGSNGELQVSSVQLSGLHRTTSEMEDKDALRVLTFGTSIKYQFKTLQVGLNMLNYHFSIPIEKKAEPANLFSIRGNHWLNYSFDYRYTFRNFFFFGEVAHNPGGQPAILSGAMAVLHPKVDISVVLRKLPPSFKSINGNAFTEQAEPGNESGLYTGLAVKFSSKFLLNVYSDVFSYPMVKSRTGAPVKGNGHLLQLVYKPDKKNSILLRFTEESKQAEVNDALQTIQPLIFQRKRQLRIHQQLVLLPGLTLNNRLDWVWLNAENQPLNEGYQAYSDLFWKPRFTTLSFGFRVAKFDTDSYDSRIYSFEKDVRNLQSVNLSSGRGWRQYFLLHYKYKSCYHFSMKYMRSYYTDNQSIGSGYDEIYRSSRSEYRLQFFIFF